LQPLRLATRGSALALAQARLVAGLLDSVEVELVELKTSGDRGVRGGDKSRWVKELEEALLDDRADLAVHSAKDVPGELPDGLSIVGVPERADARDAICGAAGVAAIPEGAVVGTSSLRRRSQLLAVRPDLVIEDMRGNVDTRLRKLRERQYDAIVLARAGLDRLGVDEGEPVDVGALTPAPGQGCLALEARGDDERAAELAHAITDHQALVELTAERAVVTALDATCHTPVGAHARLDGEHLTVDGYAGHPDGSAWIRDRVEGHGDDPSALGRELAERMLAAGAGPFLAQA
jgi:hydroxymethylbilane synthase